MLFHLRDAFRAGDVWLVSTPPVAADADRSLPPPVNPHDWLAERRFALDEGLRRLAAAARAGAIAGGSIEDSVLRVERTETAVPDGAADVVADLYRRMPEARITDILLEVDDATRFTEAFTHLRTGEPCRDRIGLLNVLLAEGVNLGLRKMAEATTTHGWELMRIARWHVEGDAFDRALAVVVEAQAALPMAAFWGTGRTASSDGQFFPAGGRGAPGRVRRSGGRRRRTRRDALGAALRCRQGARRRPDDDSRGRARRQPEDAPADEAPAAAQQAPRAGRVSPRGGTPRAPGLRTPEGPADRGPVQGATHG